MTGDQRRAVAYGLIVVTAFVAIDVALGAKAAISGSYALGAILSGVMGGFRPAVPVAVVAVVLAAASGAWNGDFGEAGADFAQVLYSYGGDAALG